MNKSTFLAALSGACGALVLLCIAAAFPTPGMTKFVGNFYGNAGSDLGLTNVNGSPWQKDNSAASFKLTQLAELDMTNAAVINQTVLTGTNTTITVVVTNDLGGVSTNVVQIGTVLTGETNAYVIQNRSGTTVASFDTNGNLILPGVINVLNFQSPTTTPTDGYIPTAQGTSGKTVWTAPAASSQTPINQDVNWNQKRATNLLSEQTTSLTVCSNTTTGPQTGQATLDGQGNLAIISTNHPLIIVTNSSGGVTFKHAETNGLTYSSGGFASGKSVAAAPTSISFPNTTVNFTNPEVFNIVLYIDNTGITGTTIKKNGTTVFTTTTGDCTLFLKPGDYFSETYTIGTPSGKYEPQ